MNGFKSMRICLKRFLSLKIQTCASVLEKMQIISDGRTPAVFGALIAELEELHKQALKKCEKAQKEKHKIQCGECLSTVHQDLNISGTLKARRSLLSSLGPRGT